MIFNMVLQRAITIRPYEKGLLYRKGKLVRVLEAGRYRVDKIFLHEDVVIVDVRQNFINIAGQEIITRDNLNLRMNLLAQYKVTDPTLAVQTVASFTSQLYLDVQMELRGLVSTRTLDELLANKQRISEEALAALRPRALGYGVEVLAVGIKDLILPGELRTILTQVVEAEKKAQAELIKARETVAAARALANTVKIYEQNPLMLRLKELETLVKMAEQRGNTFIFGLKDGDYLRLKGLGEGPIS
jgi:regulator of protease activity HflC (stomatin/prohibitin superfamily)